MRIAIVSGKSEGPTELNAFDNALYEAEIGDVNLIKVSSMLESNTKVEKLPKLKAGSMVNCVLSSLTSNKKGAEIIACVAVAIGEELGCVVETNGIDEDPEDIKNEAIDMVKYMMNKRNVKIKELIVEETHHTVKEIGSVIAAVIYIKEDILEK
ncbi:pyruvoyl-dependent arginine decarboxylase [Methanobrevibacter olleyae]|uniref:arginine decarboxylase n=1 Tax=Methanobrevibacter olleyae TaxID=294671 RepID=A0A126R122_METOL|nr:arginine decarboxylase, pyruvoyl-dependent [Methanobrevibacter olleyae]AMK15754.1 pyruvoyl-dependent arginine decarboxylase PdaD [Methanobrevibacter olleyae]SFL58848.1 arginine decarboxylase [Methanobrevibacter olleyae]